MRNFEFMPLHFHLEKTSDEKVQRAFWDYFCSLIYFIFRKMITRYANNFFIFNKIKIGNKDSNLLKIKKNSFKFFL